MIKKSILFFIIITALLLPTCDKKAEASANNCDGDCASCPSQEIRNDQGDTEPVTKNARQSETKVTFIELGSVNCIPCKQMQPIMKTIEEKYPEQVEVIFYDVWTKEGKPYAQQYKIRVIPTQVFLDSAGNEFFRHEGFFPLAEIEKILRQNGVQ
ncbi:MAG TPA: thioredoxin [Candidatus Marinimicrobia bacterium]|nr:thioredoxin [Candidatus Neomarinimicrobiota bacterium]